MVRNEEEEEEEEEEGERRVICVLLLLCVVWLCSQFVVCVAIAMQLREWHATITAKRGTHKYKRLAKSARVAGSQFLAVVDGGMWQPDMRVVRCHTNHDPLSARLPAPAPQPPCSLARRSSGYLSSNMYKEAAMPASATRLGRMAGRRPGCCWRMRCQTRVVAFSSMRGVSGK